MNRDARDVGEGGGRVREGAAPMIVGSIAVHAALAALAGVWIVRSYLLPQPPRFEAPRVVKVERERRERAMSLAACEGARAAASLRDAVASARLSEIAFPELPRAEEPPPDAARFRARLDPAGFGAGLGIGDLGIGMGAGGKGNALAFFGIADRGGSVVVMLDVSDSMFGRTGDADYRTGKLVRRGREQSFQSVRDEAARLIGGLGIDARFDIVRWSGGAHAWRGQLVPANDQNRAEALRHIEETIDWRSAPPRGGRPGGTRHDYALETALGLGPEVIYLLTDGNATEVLAGERRLREIPAERIWEAAENGQRALPNRARIHVIYYVTGAEKEEEEAMLRGLAKRNEGEFRKVAARVGRGG